MDDVRRDLLPLAGLEFIEPFVRGFASLELGPEPVRMIAALLPVVEAAPGLRRELRVPEPVAGGLGQVGILFLPERPASRAHDQGEGKGQGYGRHVTGKKFQRLCLARQQGNGANAPSSKHLMPSFASRSATQNLEMQKPCRPGAASPRGGSEGGKPSLDQEIDVRSAAAVVARRSMTPFTARTAGQARRAPPAS